MPDRPAQASAPPGPLPLGDLLDREFLAHRAKLMDLAAFLDRCKRATGRDDFRLLALKQSLPLLTDDQPDRARRILEALSDPSTEPLDESPGHPACGVPTPTA